jgi:hypothetical protein
VHFLSADLLKVTCMLSFHLHLAVLITFVTACINLDMFIFWITFRMKFTGESSNSWESNELFFHPIYKMESFPCLRYLFHIPDRDCIKLRISYGILNFFLLLRLILI